MAVFPKLRLLVGGTLIEGAQVAPEELPPAEQGGVTELMSFLGGAKRVLVLQRPVVYGADVQPNYLVIRQDQIQACEFVMPEATGSTDAAEVYESFRWEWDE